MAKAYLDICLFKTSIDKIPASPVHFLVIAFVYMLINTIQFLYADMAHKKTMHQAFGETFSILTTTAVFTIVVLIFSQRSTRLLQTLSSLYGVQIIISLLLLPLIFTAPMLLFPEQNRAILLFVAIIYLALTVIMNVWILFIQAYIFKDALNTGYSQSILVSLALMSLNVIVFKYFY